MNERKEALLKIPIVIISGIILAVWKALVEIVLVVHWIYVLFQNKRHKGMASFNNMWTSEAYRFIRYLHFATNERPFPFTEIAKVRDEIVMKK